MYIYIIIIIIIPDSVDDRDQKPRYDKEVLLILSRYQPALGNERINTKTNKYKEYIFCNSIIQLYIHYIVLLLNYMI